MPEISVIIVNWNGRHLLEDCLAGLRRQEFTNFETILVDNGSSDSSADYVRVNFPEVKLLALEENRGFTGGNIAGYALATGELIVLLNNDTEPHSLWLEEIHRASNAYPSAGSLASKMMYFDHRETIENCGFEVDMSATTVDVGRGQPDGPEWSATRKVFGACGGAVGYRRTMLEQIGFLDPAFFMIYEDVDLAFRAQLYGYECVYVPQAIVYHRYRSSIKTRPAMQVFYSQRNIDFVYLKNLPLGLIVRSAPRRLIYEVGAALHFVAIGKGAAFLRAKLDVLKQLPVILEKRRIIQRHRILTNSQLNSIMRGRSLTSKFKKFVSARLRPRGSASYSSPESEEVLGKCKEKLLDDLNSVESGRTAENGGHQLGNL